DRKRLARLDLLADRDGDRDDEARHRAQQLLAGVGSNFGRHQPGGRGLAFRIDEGLGFNAAMKQAKAIADGTHLHGDGRAVDGAVPYGLAGLPGRRQQYHRPGSWPLLSLAEEPHADAAALARNLEADLGAVEPYGAQALPHHRPPRHLPGNPSLALAEHMV